MSGAGAAMKRRVHMDEDGLLYVEDFPPCRPIYDQKFFRQFYRWLSKAEFLSTPELHKHRVSMDYPLVQIDDAGVASVDWFVRISKEPEGKPERLLERATADGLPTAPSGYYWGQGLSPGSFFGNHLSWEDERSAADLVAGRITFDDWSVLVPSSLRGVTLYLMPEDGTTAPIIPTPPPAIPGCHWEDHTDFWRKGNLFIRAIQTFECWPVGGDGREHYRKFILLVDDATQPDQAEAGQ